MAKKKGTTDNVATETLKELKKLDKLKETYGKIQYFYNTELKTPGIVTAKDGDLKNGDLMIVYDESNQKVYLYEYNGNNWDQKRDAAYSETILANVGVLKKNIFDKLREETGLLYYYYTYVKQENTILDKYAKLDKYAEIFPNKGQQGDLPIPGDKTLILNAVGDNNTLLRAAGVFISKECIEIEDGTYLFKDHSVQVSEINQGTQNNNKSFWFKNKKDYDTYHKILKSNYEPHNYYYFGLGTNDFKYFSTGEKQSNPRQTATMISGLMRIKKDTFFGTNPTHKAILPKKGDLALIFDSQTIPGQRGQTENHSKYLGVIKTVDNDNNIQYDVLPVEPINLAEIKKAPDLDKMNELAPQTTGKNLTPFQVSKDIFEKMLKICLPLLSHHNIVFNGAPGTGKTYRAKQLAKMLDAETQFVQFHPSYDYTDFVEGLRPIRNGSSIGFERRDGIFKDFCRRAAENLAASMNKTIDWKKDELKDSTQQENVPLKKFVFIIDEINRGDMSKIFGELFYSIEPNYRVKADDLKKAIKGNGNGNEIITVQTQYQNLIHDEEAFSKGFFIPENVYIIGTMNDVDRSVESMDFAMRRRFRFIEVTPEEGKGMLYDSLKDKADDAIKKMNEINKQIKEKLGDEYQIGPSYFLDLKTNPNIDLVVKQRILPLIKEYCRGDNELYKAIEEKISPFEQKTAQNDKKTGKKASKKSPTTGSSGTGKGKKAGKKENKE